MSSAENMDLTAADAISEVSDEPCSSFGVHLCIWCNNDAAREKLQVLLSNGFETFITNCTHAGRLALVSAALIKGVGDIAIHRHCRLKLSRQAVKVRKQGVAEAPARGPRTRAVAGTFQYTGSTLCLFYTEPVTTVDTKDGSKVSTLSFDNKLREIIERRKYNGWALEAQGRLEDTKQPIHQSHSCHFVDLLILLRTSCGSNFMLGS